MDERRDHVRVVDMEIIISSTVERTKFAKHAIIITKKFRVFSIFVVVVAMYGP